MPDAPVELWIQVECDSDVIASERAGLGPATEDAVFRGVLTGDIPNDGGVPALRVEPWFDDAEWQAVAGFTLFDGTRRAGSYESAIFRPQVSALLEALAEEKRVEAGARLEWELVARAPQPDAGFAVRVRRTPYPLEPGRLEDAEPGSYAVELDAGLLERLAKRVRQAYPLECASLLLGRLVHDAERGAARLRLTASIDVQPGTGGRSGAHFAFAPETFLAARAQAETRGESIAGWMHSHPPCKGCVAHPSCSANTIWFSSDDVGVHSAAFPAPFMVGLVGGKVPDRPADRPGFRLYGWREGVIAERELNVIDTD